MAIKKIKVKLYQIFLLLFSILFGFILLGSIFDNKSLIAVINPFLILGGFLLTTGIFFILYKILLKKGKKDFPLKKEITIVAILGIIFLLAQAIYAYFMRSYPGWDWNDVMTAARQYTQGDLEHIDWEYFQMFPNNNWMLYLEIVFFKVLSWMNIRDFYQQLYATIAANILLIDTSIVFLYLTVRKLLGNRQAIFSLLICMTCFAFYCYIPVFYTDTITMVIPMAILYLYFSYQKEEKKRYLVEIAILSFIGYHLKPTTIIVLVAIIIDTLLRKNLKETWKGGLVFIGSFLVTALLLTTLETKLSIFPYDIRNNQNEIPYTHWIMMGLRERNSYVKGRKFIGWYDSDSYIYTLSYKTTSERKKANIKRIQTIFKEMGPINYGTFLYRKLLFTWSDGTFYAPALINNTTIKEGSNPVKEWVETSGKYIKITYVQNMGMILFMYFFMMIGAFLSFKKKKHDMNVGFLTIFGLLLFLLIWEDSSRYLITYIPVFVLCTIYGLNAIIKKENELKAEQKNNQKIKLESGEHMFFHKEPILYVVVPCYNEEEVLEETTRQLKIKMQKLIKDKEISGKSKVMYVNDGSKDATWDIIKEISEKEKLFTGITLSRNRGHQNALLGGLMTAKNYADIVISMDADLQDDINAMDEMIKKYKEGCDIVYGVRSARKKDTFFKRVTAEGFYKFMKVLGVDCVYNHADYRLTSKRVLEEFSNYKEVNLFLRGMFPLVGFKSDVVYYERNERFAGESKYPLKKMLNFAWDGITSFSVKPLRFICILGFIILFISIAIMIYSLVRFLTGNTVDGWTFLSISIWFIGGLQMISIGIIGEYVGKMYNETKARPRYIIAENLEEEKKLFK